ncbi:hypothetical protein Prum_010040 [Phytohabitans rumicis]|uniref:Uncharacterized protein n=1 Tax=Phytohabitans rumicis TaxID=1076125 RepID=A0A6V8KQA9_9ACTN|nr:hypothetical protein Prum_010040 [Phytohabitans rumicis]
MMAVQTLGQEAHALAPRARAYRNNGAVTSLDDVPVTSVTTPPLASSMDPGGTTVSAEPTLHGRAAQRTARLAGMASHRSLFT